MNLNDLSEKDLNELENYINNKIGKEKSEIKILFVDLRSGKLKNKNVDIDALDFVYDGLTSIVEQWLKRDKASTLPKKVELSNALKMLFERKLQFQYEDKSSLQSIVEKLLLDNSYPRRSKNIKLPNAIKPNERFIKDGYLYLLRGAEYGQMSGFFAYPYCQSKMNLEEYCKRNPTLTPKQILDKYTEIGKGYFISATTKIPVTTQFCHEVNGREGSIYIIRIKPTEVIALEPHKPMYVPSFIDMETFNEEEYVIPDYVMPNELVEEFKYTDYVGVFKYLNETIGLNITPQDVGFVRSIEQEKDKLIKNGNFVRETEEKYFDDWEKQDYESALNTMMKEISKKYESEGR